MAGPQAHLISGDRLHLHHGPIDLIIEAWGQGKQQAYAQATRRFQTVLSELVEELDILRRPPGQRQPSGPVAGRMMRAVQPHRGRFVTPMAAVAGAVADEICAAMCRGTQLDKAVVNNGGDIAIYLTPGQRFVSAIHADGHVGQVTFSSENPARGLATSGWRGRSHSLGIADAVTVLAKTAAMADVAATLIANAVDLPGHGAIRRVAANTLAPDSDLGPQKVTVDVGLLNDREIACALATGQKCAENMHRDGLIDGAVLFLGQQQCITGPALTQTHRGDRYARLQTA